MNFSSAKSSDENKTTIRYQTEGSGYVVGEKAGIERLAEFLKGENVVVTNIRPLDGLCCFDFTALQAHINQALSKWPEVENYEVIFERPNQSG
jgi:hypothetical protein